LPLSTIFQFDFGTVLNLIFHFLFEKLIKILKCTSTCIFR